MLFKVTMLIAFLNRKEVNRKEVNKKELNSIENVELIVNDD